MKKIILILLLLTTTAWGELDKFVNPNKQEFETIRDLSKSGKVCGYFQEHWWVVGYKDGQVHRRQCKVCLKKSLWNDWEFKWEDE